MPVKSIELFKICVPSKKKRNIGSVARLSLVVQTRLYGNVVETV